MFSKRRVKGIGTFSGATIQSKLFLCHSEMGSKGSKFFPFREDHFSGGA